MAVNGETTQNKKTIHTADTTDVNSSPSEPTEAPLAPDLETINNAAPNTDTMTPTDIMPLNDTSSTDPQSENPEYPENTETVDPSTENPMSPEPIT